MPKVAYKGLALFEGDGKVVGIDIELMDDSTIRVKKGAKVLHDEDEIVKGAAKKDTVLPMFRDAVRKAASGSHGAGEVDSLMPSMERGLHDPRFVPNGGFVTPTGLPNSSARMPDGRPPLFAELDIGSSAEIQTEKALADARARKAARDARSAGPSIETSKLRPR